jgi:hypothetical protein
VEVTEVTHPSVEEVAEHLEGVLSPGDEQRVRAHLDECAECAATARELAAVTERLRASAAAVPPIPGDVAARVEAALAEQAREPRASADRDVPTGHAGVSRGVRPTHQLRGPGEADDLEERRRRRRRVLSGGLLAAAAATVVAVGVGEMVQSGLSGSGDAAQESAVTADRGAAGAGDPPADRPGARSGGGPQVAQAPRAEAGSLAKDRSEPPAFRDRRAELGLAGLVQGVAAAHTPARPRHDRADCVAAALGDGAGASVASYSVDLPGAVGVGGAVVVLRPSDAPTVGLLLECTPRPRVLLRRGLAP